MNINKSLFWNNGNGHDRPCVVNNSDTKFH